MANVKLILTIVAFAVGAIILILSGVLGWVVVPNIIEDRVEEEQRLSAESDTFEKWKDLPVPIYSSFYFFHLKNIEDFTGPFANLSSVPLFEEVGPYAFREIRNKTIVGFGNDDTIFYRQNVAYVFDEEKSGKGLKVTDNVTILNVPFITALTFQDIHSKTHSFSQTVLSSLLKAGETLFMTAPVGKVLFGFKLPNVYRVVETLGEQLLGIPMPEEILNGEYAFFRGKNNTHDGIWEVYRGIKDSSKFNTIKSIKGETTLNRYWKGNCAMINGTDGSMFPPFVDEDTRLDIYVPEICRSLYLLYDSKVKFEGIQGYRFKMPDALFDPELPENECFCTKMKEPLESSCDKKGLWKIFTCKAEVPVVVSKPHYLGADEDVQMVGHRSGLRPSADEHESYIDIEPYTGSPLRVHMRIQIGAEIQSYHYLNRTPFNTIPHVFYPALWLDKNAELDEPLIDEIKDKLVKPLNIVKITKWTLIGVGSFLVIGGVLGFFFVRRGS